MQTRTSISFNLPAREATRTKKLARKRGFPSTAEYIRYLISQDDEVLISEDELYKRQEEAEQLYKAGKFIKAKSVADLLK